MNMRGMMSSSACTMTNPLGSGGATSLTATAAGVDLATPLVGRSFNGSEAEVEASSRSGMNVGARSEVKEGAPLELEDSRRSEVEGSKLQVSEVQHSTRGSELKGKKLEGSTRSDVEASER
eukprot:CAMPEP_0195586290 /NCGR_PEP_ID=MMETSP0814-20130614/29099_1 /TAXON_ID=97485 /ORGANISM="Prymnesium parvum, Strain Texoma1" /LENGTH=120 /DNA_ID=CAMNT_0040724795 /DNA_START=1 /DNA_END=363 /DNA_ORIENTATION=+